jgi:colanic acid/amylovoran biosynthesis protein
MKILITHVYSQDNKGDSAILSVLIAQLKKTFPNSEINISSMEGNNKTKKFDDQKIYPSFFHLAVYRNKNFIIRTLSTLYILLISLIWAFIYRTTGKKLKVLDKDLEKLLTLYVNSDLIIPVGGGYINGKKGMRSTIALILTLHSIAISEILGKKTILHSQSIGPFSNNLQKYLTKKTLNKTDLILIRENYSLQTLIEIGVNPRLIKRVADAAFLFNPPITNHKTQIDTIKKTGRKKIVGVTVRNWLDKSKQEFYETQMAKFVEYLTKKNYLVVFIPQVTSDEFNDDDRLPAKRIFQKVKDQKNVILINDSLSHYAIKALYGKLDYLVGTRLHSVLFALTSNIPSIAIEYEYKTSGILKDIGLNDYIIKIQEVTSERLIQIFNKLVRTESKYRDQLATNINPMKRKAEIAMDMVQETYQFPLQ